MTDKPLKPTAMLLGNKNKLNDKAESVQPINKTAKSTKPLLFTMAGTVFFFLNNILPNSFQSTVDE